MAIFAPATDSVNGTAPPCAIATERQRLNLILDVALRHERLAADEVRTVELQHRGYHWHRRLLTAERTLSIAHTAVIDAYLALAVLATEPAAVHGLSDLESAFAAEHGLLPSDELGGGW